MEEIIVYNYPGNHRVKLNSNAKIRMNFAVAQWNTRRIRVLLQRKKRENEKKEEETLKEEKKTG